MALSIGKIEALHTLVVALTGLVLAVSLSWAALQLESAQQNVGEDALSLRDLTRLQDTTRQLLVMGDLIYGSGETYLIEGAHSLGEAAREIVDSLGGGPLAAECEKVCAELQRLLADNHDRLQAAALISVETEVEVASRLLDEWDSDSMAMVGLLQQLEAALSGVAQSRFRQVEEQRSLLMTSTLLAGTLYALLVLLSWRWVRAVLVVPLRNLADASDQALLLEKPVSLIERGPEEIRHLTRSIRAFVLQLEQRVRERTETLVAREQLLIEEIATRQEAEETAARAREAAEAANEAKSQFLANMSHEIRTPLNGVLGGAELALRAASDPDQRETLKVILNSGTRLMGVINDVLDFSKLDSGRFDFRSASFEVQRVLRDVGELFAPRADEKGLELILAPDIDGRSVLIGDSLRITQVLSNLVGNAIKFTEQGEVVVRTQVSEQADGRCLLRVEVQDTGIGIEPALQRTVFEPFRQADGSTTRVWSGTGLGLSICKRFVELMGGEIGVVSKPGEGATFWCTMLLDAGIEPVRMSTLRQRVQLRIGTRALNDYLDQVLRFWGCEVVETGASVDGDVVVICDELSDDLPADTELILLRTVSAPRPKLKCSYTTLNKPIVPELLHDLIEQKMAGAARTPQLPAAEDLHSYELRVLVVEDNAVNQMIVRKMLLSLGCEAMIADDGQSGLAALQSEQFDLVLMDWHMPNMDGLEATRRARAWEREHSKSRLPILALTANAMEGDEQKCLDAGMDGYLSKPLTIDALCAALDEVLPGASKSFS